MCAYTMTGQSRSSVTKKKHIFCKFPVIACRVHINGM